jgi:hypothetical protein
MRNLLALVGAAVVTFAAAGWYLGWYKLQPTLSSTPGHQSVNIDIDGKKIKADEKRAEQAIEKALQSTTARGTASPAPVKATAQ